MVGTVNPRELATALAIDARSWKKAAERWDELNVRTQRRYLRLARRALKLLYMKDEERWVRLTTIPKKSQS